MEYTTLGNSEIKVSRLCLGSMNWGTRNTEDEGHAQLDKCLDAGINFVDTAEMYPTYPVTAETVGGTEEIIGTWNAKSGRRSDYVIATKVSGPNGGFIRDGKGYDRAIILEAVEASLKRLQTDYIDLYQLHWPTRGSYHFRQNWDYDPSSQDRDAVREHMLEVLQVLGELVKAGKIRTFGLSNETTWGTAEWLRLAREHGYPEVVSIQNEYSLLCRQADTDLAELCHHENVGLLPFTPLGGGLISGRYAPDVTPANSRRARESTLNGRITERVWPAIDAYIQVAEKHGHDVNTMALAWTLSRPFVASSIFGASDDAQLDVAIASGELKLSDACLADINAAHKAHPMPY